MATTLTPTTALGTNSSGHDVQGENLLEFRTFIPGSTETHTHVTPDPNSSNSISIVPIAAGAAAGGLCIIALAIVLACRRARTHQLQRVGRDTTMHSAAVGSATNANVTLGRQPEGSGAALAWNPALYAITGPARQLWDPTVYDTGESASNSWDPAIYGRRATNRMPAHQPPHTYEQLDTTSSVPVYASLQQQNFHRVSVPAAPAGEQTMYETIEDGEGAAHSRAVRGRMVGTGSRVSSHHRITGSLTTTESSM
eukprot:m.154691 g.154691  ORF g.154691 m.154691 type:complete len:254 (+) comp15133_c0_seq3:248-1009(+)